MIKKFISKNKHLIQCSREVLKAIDNKIPLVALESSIISHGMPYPQSLEMAKDIEEIIALVKPIMENAHLPIKPLNVKLSVDHGFAKNWADAH